MKETITPSERKKDKNDSSLVVQLRFIKIVETLSYMEKEGGKTRKD